MLRAALLTLFILIVLPAAANAACRQAPVAAVYYDSPVLQVWTDDQGVVSCLRPTGIEHVYRDTGDDPEAELVISGAWGDRWLTLERQKAYDSDPDDPLVALLGSVTYDTWTGAPRVQDWWITKGKDGIVVHHADGRTQVVDPTPVRETLNLVFRGERIYWRTPGGPRTAMLDVPAEPAPPRAAPLRARRMANCTPRPGADLLARYRRLVVTRKGAAVHVCSNRRVTPIGAVRTFAHVGFEDLAYTRRGVAGYVNATSGRKRELPSAGGPIAADFWNFAAVDRRGVLRAWLEHNRRPTVIARGGASEVVVDDRDVFWLGPDGRPHVKRVHAVD